MDTKIRSSIYFFDKHPYIAIIGMGILLRLIVAFFYQHVAIYPDSWGYIYLAEKLSALSLKDYIGIRTPGYPLLLVLASINIMTIVLLQNILGIVTSVCIFKTLMIIRIGKRNALIFTLLWTAYLPAIFFEYCILSESLTLLNITLIFYFLFKILYTSNRGLLNYVILSLLCSYIVIIKPFYIFVPFVNIFILLFSKRTRQIRNYTIIIIFPILTFTGWCSINFINTGYFTPTTLYGYTTAQTCVYFAENTNTKYKEIGNIYAKHRYVNQAKGQDISMSIWDAYKELKQSTNLFFVDLSKQVYDYSLVTICLNPLDYAKQVCISWIDFWKTSIYWQYDSFGIKTSSNIIKVICTGERIILQLLKIIFVLLIPYNLYRCRHNNLLSPQFVISIVVLLISLLQALSTYGTNSRFSFPFEALIAISALMNINSFLRKRNKIS